MSIERRIENLEKLTEAASECQTIIYVSHGGDKETSPDKQKRELEAFIAKQSEQETTILEWEDDPFALSFMHSGSTSLNIAVINHHTKMLVAQVIAGERTEP